MRIGLQIIAAACFTLAISNIQGFTTMSPDQVLAIESTSWNQTLEYSYGQNIGRVSEPVFGDRFINAKVPIDDWKGVYMYDYSTGAFQEGFYFYDNFL